MDNDGASADCQPDRHNLVPGASSVEVFGQRPRSCISIIRLNGRTTPGRVTIAANEDFAIASHNGDHYDVIDESAQYSAIGLSKEHGTGRDLDCVDASALEPTDRIGKYHVRYSPIFKSPHRLTVFEMILCDQAAKYMLPTGRPGSIRPASNFDRLFVAIPLPKRE